MRSSVVQPHKHAHVLGVTHNATHADAAAAVTAAKNAAPMWRDMSYADRAAIFLRAADLLAGPWRDTINGATMLGQSKTAYQAEIDAACELIDFLRFNVAFGAKLLAEQPLSSPGVWNQFDHRPLEGFVYAITPFNFTAIAGNLPTAPALMGNTVLWKPSPTQQFAAHYVMRLFEAAGLPPGVINMVTGDGIAVSDVALADPDLAGIHFTGSTKVFQHLWQTVGEQHRELPDVPAPGRRDRRQGLRDRASVGRRRCAAHRAHPRRVRLPGPEVLGGVARVHPALDLGRRPARPAGRDRRRPDLRRRHRLPELRRRGDRRPRVREARGRARHDQELSGVHGHRRWHRRRRGGILRPADRRRVLRPDARGVHDRVLRPDPVRLRVRRCQTSKIRRRAGRIRLAVRADRVDLRDRPPRRGVGVEGRCATPPATSTSTTSRPVPSSASSRSVARGPRAPTTRPVRGRTWRGGCRPGRSRRRSWHRPTTRTHIWAKGFALFRG